MEDYFNKVKKYLLELNCDITYEDPKENLFVVNDESAGLNNLVIGVANPIVIFEQFIFELKHDSFDICKQLLQKNRDIIHGAFVLDDSGKRVIFRDTLQLENIDLNEVEASINSLSLLLSEYSDVLIKFAHN